MTTQKIIGIIGAGVAGPALGVQILSHPILRTLYKPVIYDPATDPKDQAAYERLSAGGAAVALFPNGLFPLYQLGFKEALEELSCDVNAINLWRGGIGSGASAGEDINLAPQTWHRLNSRLENVSWSTDVQSNGKAIARQDLVSMLLDRYSKLSGDIHWKHKLEHVEEFSGARIKTMFANGKTAEVDLLVGAEGAWSVVRKHILQSRNAGTAHRRWQPKFCNSAHIYGLADVNNEKSLGDSLGYSKKDTQSVWTDGALLSSSPLPNNRVRWDLTLPEDNLLPRSSDFDKPSEATAWESKIVCGHYPRSETTALLRRHASIFHPSTGTFGALVASSDRIIHSPLRQRVWTEKEIQYRNMVLIGDAAHLLLPSSGQGSGFAIEDAVVLAKCILDDPLSLGAEEDQKALETYAKARVPRAQSMAQQAALAGNLGLGYTWYWRIARSILFAITWTRTRLFRQPRKNVTGFPFGQRYSVPYEHEKATSG